MRSETRPKSASDVHVAVSELDDNVAMCPRGYLIGVPLAEASHKSAQPSHSRALGRNAGARVAPIDHSIMAIPLRIKA
jgi:hypothetical protein